MTASWWATIARARVAEVECGGRFDVARDLRKASVAGDEHRLRRFAAGTALRVVCRR